MAEPRIAPAARADLRDIRIYSKAAFGAPVARKYLDGLRAALTLLRTRPYAGSAEDDLGASVRGFTYRSHRIYYRVDASGLLIIRVLHYAQNARAVLKENQ